MKNLLLLSVFLIGTTGITMFAQTRVSSTLTVSDNAGSSRLLTFGIDPSATDGIDASLETVQSAIPAAGVFDVRFIGSDIAIAIGNGLIEEYREGSITTDRVHIHEIIFQPKAGGSEITLAWNLHAGVSLRIQDVVTGAFLDNTVTGAGTFTLTDPGTINKLKLTATYTAASMPVELTRFTAAVNGREIVLLWRTETETNNYGFTIERKNGEEGSTGPWQEIGFVEGHGTCWSAHEYRFVDRTASMPAAFTYRLKQIDRNGKSEYSHSVNASLILPRHFDLGRNYPNPFNPSTSIPVSLPSASEVSLRVYDVTGAELERILEREPLSAGTYTFQWNAGREGAPYRASGMYIIRMTGVPLDGSGPAFLKSMKVVLTK